MEHDWEEFQTTHSSDPFERMGARINLQALGEYIRSGDIRVTICDQPFRERMDDADHLLSQRLGALIKDQDSTDPIREAISEYDFALIDVYFTLGMKAGAQLNALLMGGFGRE